MVIKQAVIDDKDTVYHIVQDTIQEIYPRYYPSGAVDFFCTHHSIASIEEDIESGHVWILQDSTTVGTVSIRNYEISRLFVLPIHQDKGYGGKLMDFAENLIFQQYPYIVLDASFPAQEMYLKRGYKTLGFQKILCDKGDFLCYSQMKLEQSDTPSMLDVKM